MKWTDQRRIWEIPACSAWMLAQGHASVLEMLMIIEIDNVCQGCAIICLKDRDSKAIIVGNAYSPICLRYFAMIKNNEKLTKRLETNFHWCHNREAGGGGNGTLAFSIMGCPPPYSWGFLCWLNFRFILWLTLWFVSLFLLLIEKTKNRNTFSLLLHI